MWDTPVAHDVVIKPYKHSHKGAGFRAARICGWTGPTRGSSRVGEPRPLARARRWSSTGGQGCAPPGWRLSRGHRRCPAVFMSCPTAGSWKSPKHTTPETLSLTESPLRPKIGITGLLNLLAWVEQKRVAHAAQQKEGGVPCPAPHPSQFPPAHVQATQHPVGAVTPSQSPALTRAPKPLTRTPARAAKRPRQGGQR